MTSELIGKKFGRLTVVSEDPSYGSHSNCECRCDCTLTITTRRGNLLSGNTTSCGCSHISSATKHGLSKRPEYGIWERIKQRCENSNSTGYRWYGARGIAICEKWAKSVEDFIMDMGPRPSPKHSVERLNNYGNYEPGNCIWATQTEQCRNRRSNFRITLEGRTLCLTEWTIVSGLSRCCLRNRIKRGWPIKEALTAPTVVVRPRINGKYVKTF